MEIPDTMIDESFKKSARYKYYMAKKVESEKANAIEEPEEQNVSPVKSGKGKGYMRSGDNEENLNLQNPSILEQRTQQHRRSQLTIDRHIDNDVADTYVKWGQKLKGPAVEDPAVQSLLELQKGSKASRLESLKQKKQAVAGEGSKESANGTDDADDSDMDLFDDNLDGDDDAAGFGVFMYNKSIETPKSTYLSLTITTSSLNFIQNLLHETPVNELTDLISNPVYTDAHTTSVVHNPEGNPKVRSFLSGASEVPFGTHVDVQATNLVLQEMFPDDAAHHISSPLATKTHKLPANPQPNSLQAKAKKLMQKAKKNMRKINFKKAVAQKFREYDQKLEALTNFNVSEAFKKVVQTRILTKIKKFLPTYITTAIANYVKPHLNTSVLEQALDAQDAEPSFYKRSHDNQDTLNDRKREKRKKQRKDVGQSSSRSSRRNKSPMVHAQDDTPVVQSLNLKDEYIWTCPNPEWYTKSGSIDVAKRKMTWFDLLLKSYIGQNGNHIIRPSIVAIAKKLKAIIQKDELTIADLEGEGAGLERIEQQYQNDVELEYHINQLKAVVLSEAKWNSDEDDVSKPRTFKRHMYKNTKLHPSFYNNDFYYLVCMSMEEKYTTSITKHYAARYYKQGIEDMISDKWCKETHSYIFEALNVRRSGDNEYEFSHADLPRLSLNDVEDMYLLQVQDKLHYIPLEFVKDFNNALLLFI
ncbi:hypothetical protein Tco_0992783 [Tanacetum coccineum]|uniref:Uncharacterized protein n=1 Tax=Tanacetum coccineum TaxID=301880 RepID=A0ABQ5F3W6_9ASTR